MPEGGAAFTFGTTAASFENVRRLGRSAAEGPRVRRLSAGGSRIRTLGPPSEGQRFRDAPVQLAMAATVERSHAATVS